ncbi:CAAX prenyl protease-like protein [Aliiruegeria haliotis]|uniref:CAAX prenyl protease-like protein n=1 Tax=Aliiruegeria haliotis TaxID=1280846 RepID=A0A2T0RKY8_9RHOB|nr:CPBP family intramembrane glutamic endopeptidase [Aliiruegeria haliotis]PRY21790.1 CAAX prenyl protease-like protein [Aliiruegeria haliotis]
MARSKITTSATAASPARLWSEFVLFFGAAPLTLALLLPPDRMFPMLFAVTALGMILLHMTPSFRWADLLDGRDRIRWGAVVGIGALVLAFGVAWLALARPDDLFQIARRQPLLLAMILLLYPLVSALPQEIVYRALFFRRYAPILPRRPKAMLLANAALFSMAHLMYWSWIVLVMTFLGGLAFAWAYQVRRSFPIAVLLHAVAGNAIFLVGLGAYFYSGNVVRPF